MSNRLALCDVSGPLIDLIQKLSGENGEEWQNAITKMLRKVNPWEAPRTTTDFPLPVWKTLRLGTLRKPDLYHKLMSVCAAADWSDVKDIFSFGEFWVCHEERDVDLVKLSVSQLDICGAPLLENIYKRARELGLELCLPEVAPQILLQWWHLLEGKYCVVAMNPIKSSDGSPRIFCVGSGERTGRFIVRFGFPSTIFSTTDQFIFALPRKSGGKS